MTATVWPVSFAYSVSRSHGRRRAGHHRAVPDLIDRDFAGEDEVGNVGYEAGQVALRDALRFPSATFRSVLPEDTDGCKADETTFLVLL